MIIPENSLIQDKEKYERFISMANNRSSVQLIARNLQLPIELAFKQHGFLYSQGLIKKH